MGRSGSHGGSRVTGARRRVGGWLGCALVIALPACSSSLPSPFSRRTTQVFVTVANRNWTDHTIFVSRGGARARLGLVSSNQTRTFRLPPDMTHPGIAIYFLADPVGSDQVYSSPQVSLNGGETWVWTLMPQIEQSTLVLR